jgi:hypothetical protein
MKKTLAAVVSLGMIVCGAGVAAGQAHPTIPIMNSSHDPFQSYGGCVRNFSGFIPKLALLQATGKTLENVTAIDVIDCHEFDGGGGVSTTPCPTGSPYEYCLVNHNDGLANSITIGVVKLTPANDPLGQYGGCATGTGFRPKRNLVREAGFGLRDVDNIVVIDCHAADGAPGAKVVPCPAKPNPYLRCLRNRDDGVGNSVLVGVVKSYGPGDPYSLYGGCYTNAGYRSKATLVTDAGKNLSEVVAIQPLGCSPGSGPRQAPTVVACSDIGVVPPFPSYDYCLFSRSDGKGNALYVGVITYH